MFHNTLGLRVRDECMRGLLTIGGVLALRKSEDIRSMTLRSGVTCLHLTIIRGNGDMHTSAGLEHGSCCIKGSDSFLRTV